MIPDYSWFRMAMICTTICSMAPPSILHSGMALVWLCFGWYAWRQEKKRQARFAEFVAQMQRPPP